MASVYTESVVTLNSSQAEATMNALKASADELRKKMIEATKLGNTDDAAKYQKQLDQVNKSMAGIKKETKDYSEIMKNLNGSTLNQLAKAYSGLNKQLKNLVPGTKEFIEKSQQLKQVKARMDEINASSKGISKSLGGIKNMIPKIGLAGLFAAAAKAVIKFGKDMVSQTQLLGDKWAQFTGGMKSAYSSFLTDLTSGKGWKELIANMKESYKVGKEVTAILDEIFERQNSLSLKESEYNIEIERNKQLMRDTSKSDEERIAAAEEVIRLERELANEKKNIAAQEVEARKLELQNRTKLTDAELEAYVAGYNNNREIIQQAQEYSSQLDSAKKSLEQWQWVYSQAEDDYSSDIALEHIEQLKQKIVALTNSTSDQVKQFAEMDAKYQLTNDELVKSYVDSVIKMNQAEASFYSSTTRAATTVATLKNDLSKDHQANLENAYKKEISDTDVYYQELQVKAKEAYASGEINEQQYQARLKSIQEQGLKAKLAIAERYKKDTIDIQSQLLDLTISQKEEFKKIMEDIEQDFEKFLADMSAEIDLQLEEDMSEIDAELQGWLDHFLDLVSQADDVKAALDPKSALGAQLQTELASLDEMYENKLLSEEEYQQARQNLIKNFAQQNMEIDLAAWQGGMESAMMYANEVGNMVSALKEAQLTSLDAQMQAELTAAGDNAEAREQIEAKYEQKKLETQKKYAVADMVINIAKTVAAGALAVMQAFAQLGPIAGAVMAAIIGVTTAAEIATIVAQKNAIMNTTVNSSGSSSAGARVPTGYATGGYTTALGNDYQEVGVVHANEWVAPAAMVRANPIVFRRLEQARVNRGHVSGVAGFADGGMTSPSDALSPATGYSALSPELLNQLNGYLSHIINNGIPAYVILSQLNAAQDLNSTLKSVSGKK